MIIKIKLKFIKKINKLNIYKFVLNELLVLVN